MLLRIPVYKQQKKEVIDTLVDEGKGTQVYIVKPKETKWRIAYNFKITIPELEALNPKIQEGLIAGQQIKVPILSSFTPSQTWNSKYNYYTVRPKEGYYRIEKKIGVTKTVLDSLNPQISELGLQAGMVLRVPGEAKGDFRIENDLLVEKLSLWIQLIDLKLLSWQSYFLLRQMKLNTTPLKIPRNYYKQEIYTQYPRIFILGFCLLLIL